MVAGIDLMVDDDDDMVMRTQLCVRTHTSTGINTHCTKSDAAASNGSTFVVAGFVISLS
jgi:hypothetical protein